MTSAGDPRRARRAARPARADAAGRARRARRLARRRHGDDGRLLARDRLRPRRRAGRPARRARALHARRARRRSTRACRALPNLEARSYRNEQLNQLLRAGSQRTRKGAVTAVLGGRRGYLVVDGRDLRDGEIGDVVIERGLAREWDLRSATRSRRRAGATATARSTSGRCGSSGSRSRRTTSRIPLASAARVYVTEQEFATRSGSRPAGCARTPRCCGSTTRRRPT